MKTYTIHEVLKAGYTLEPMKCLHCGSVGETTFDQQVHDAYCAVCGKWQLPENQEELSHEIR